jgi:hypothetical protein
MNKNDSYQSWLEKRRSTEISREFSKDVIDRISLYEQKQRETKPGWEMARWLEWVSLTPLMQTALIIAGIVVGAARWIAALQIILSF